MGAWGHDSFDNDDAGDWVYELEESSDMSVIDEALNAVTDDAEEYIEAPECSMAIAASEVVAALHGKASESLPESVQAWINGKPKPDKFITAKATRAIDAVLKNSELKELWEENAEDYPKWLAVLNDIKSRIPTVA
jgi:hypothetical protein